KPRTLSVGEALNDWKLDSISPEEVSLSGPGGTRTLQPKVDTTLVRQARVPTPPAQSPPAAPAGTQPQAAVPPGARVLQPPTQPGRAAAQPQVAAPAAPLRVGAPTQQTPRPRPPLAPSVPGGPVPAQLPVAAPPTNQGR